MAGPALTTAATMLCPHGGTVSAIPASGRVLAQSPLLSSADTFMIAGCTFAPGGVASPCLTVQWVVSDNNVKVGGAPSLSSSSTGLCSSGAGVPQGSVIIANTQARLSTR